MKRSDRSCRPWLPLAAAFVLLGGITAAAPAALTQEAPALRSLRMLFQRDQGTPRLILLLSPT
jgi:hypothetical protein